MTHRILRGPDDDPIPIGDPDDGDFDDDDFDEDDDFEEGDDDT